MPADGALPTLISSMKKFPVFLVGLFCAGLALVILFTFRDYGLVWDSEVQKNYGNLVLLYYLTAFANKTALAYLDLQYFGGGYETLLQIVANTVLFVTGGGLFETRHLLNALTGLAGVYTAYRCGRLILDRWTGLFAAVFLALTPRFYGHMFNNSKDAPLTVFYLLSLYWIIRFLKTLPRPDRRTILFTGLAIGFTMSIRVGAGVLFVYLLAVVCAYFVLNLKQTNSVDLRRAAVALLGTGALAWVLMLAFWPWAQVSPILRPIEAAILFTRYDYNTPQLFLGALVSSRALPVDYIPRWWLVEMPEFYFVLALAPLLLVLRRPPEARATTDRTNAVAIFALVLAVALPATIAITRGMVLTDGIRHFLFLCGPASVLAAVVLRLLLLRLNGFLAAVRYVLGGAVVFSLLLTARDMTLLHPYQMVYFNRLFGGGVRAASRQFDFDYWGNSLKEGVEWLLANHRPEPGRVYTVTNCSQLSQIEYWLNNEYYSEKEKILFRFGRSMDTPPVEIMRFLNNPPGVYKVGAQNDPPDFLLATERFNCHKKYPGTVLHKIEREGATLLYIIEVAKNTPK